ncbi:hypothetical protein RJ639_022033 [Escallonia herrerae]|uniref:Uncharacterized protein n=1 Tax=Escallonia herrerae TaxID=1293975 RepID=A0AA88V3H5_9ASTE|nr:hypothetical protein RJ639_022033 [Escallonia herrerae]
MAGGGAVLRLVEIGRVCIRVTAFKWRSAPGKLMEWSKRGNYHDVEAILKSYGSLAPKRYHYSDVKR